MMLIIMDNSIISALCMLSLVSGAVHHPKVREDQTEQNTGNENIRTIRNPQVNYKTTARHLPHTFNFASSKQQDYLRHRYAEQQMVDMARLARMLPKNRQRFYKPNTARLSSSQVLSGNHRIKKDAEHWQPFNPDLNRANIEHQTTNAPSGNNNKANGGLQETTERHEKDLGVSTESSFSKSKASDIKENKDQIKRIDSQKQRSLVFIDTNLFRRNFRKDHENTDMNTKHPEIQLTALNELIGKNPNLQLEGLKILLGQSANDKNLPVINGPQPFRSNGFTPVTENTIDVQHYQNIPVQAGDVDNTLETVPVPHIPPGFLDKDSFESLQKQFDEASKAQTEQFLAKARQDAKAQVEAQHKAIAEAQKAALENFQKNLKADPTLAAVSNYESDINKVLPQPQALTQPTSIPEHSIISATPIVQPVTPYTAHYQDVPVTESLPKYTLHQQVATPLIKNWVPLKKDPHPQSYGSKERRYYAPSHQYQAIAQNQAKRVIMAQIKAQNNAILSTYKGSTPNHHRPLEVLNEEVDGNNVINIRSAPPPQSVNTYHQQVHQPDDSEIDQDSSIKKLYVSEEESYDDPEDLQYAAKYAFGYRIKDEKEGNDFGHEERRNGKSAEGSYHVLLPDGRLQKVQYYADKSGYHARVTYEHGGHK